MRASLASVVRRFASGGMGGEDEPDLGGGQQLADVVGGGSRGGQPLDGVADRALPRRFGSSRISWARIRRTRSLSSARLVSSNHLTSVRTSFRLLPVEFRGELGQRSRRLGIAIARGHSELNGARVQLDGPVSLRPRRSPPGARR